MPSMCPACDTKLPESPTLADAHRCGEPVAPLQAFALLIDPHGGARGVPVFPSDDWMRGLRA